MSDADEVAGVFDVIDSENTAHDQIEEEVSTEPVAEGADAPEGEQKPTEDESSSTETGQSDEGQSQQTEGDESQESSEEQKPSEDSQEKSDETSKTEQTDAEISDWKKTLPPPPPEYQGKVPEFDESGQITNMTPQEYTQYNVDMARQANRQDNYSTLVETRALDVAEQIIPDIKTNAGVRQMVQAVRTSAILQGKEMDTVQAALVVREALGLTPERIQAAKTEGAQNAKVSIETQKNAALETGASQKPDADAQKETDLVKRVRKGDDNAFAELLGEWEKKGILQ